MSGTVSVDVGGARLTCLVDGDPDAPLVLCAHGFPDGARTFRAQAPALVAAGYRVVAPWLRGYAPSSLARDGRYDVGALADDLCALTRHFSPAAPIALVGHDWGALAAYAACARAPSLFSRLCTIGVPHLRVAWRRFASPAQLRRSWYIALFQLPAVGERALARDGYALVERLWHAWSPSYTPPPEELAHIRASLAAPGGARAVLGYYRALGRAFGRALGRGWAGANRTLLTLLTRRTRIPALYVHGLEDGCVGAELAEGVAAGYRGPIEVHRLAGAGHFVHLERSDDFNARLLGFLRRRLA